MKIAIQGHPTRGHEVIQILESLGGINSYNYLGDNPTCYYEIHDIILCAVTKSNHYKYYTLEEFEKEFPFKVGDKVITTYGSVGIIRALTPENDEIPYCIETEKGYIYRHQSDLKPYKEMEEERNITLTLDKAKEWYNKGGELKEIALQAFTEKELTKVDLPKTWEEFCEKYSKTNDKEYFITSDSNIQQLTAIVPNRCRLINGDKNICPSKKSAEAHLALIQLEQLRDCYRGLFVTVIGMPVWCIIRHNGILVLRTRTWGTNETFLSFQSKEVAEEYFKNFKPLIEKAGDLI